VLKLTIVVQQIRHIQFDEGINSYTESSSASLKNKVASAALWLRTPRNLDTVSPSIDVLSC
jgi:hypothetical protein